MIFGRSDGARAWQVVRGASDEDAFRRRRGSAAQSRQHGAQHRRRALRAHPLPCRPFPRYPTPRQPHSSRHLRQRPSLAAPLHAPREGGRRDRTGDATGGNALARAGSPGAPWRRPRSLRPPRSDDRRRTPRGRPGSVRDPCVPWSGDALCHHRATVSRSPAGRRFRIRRRCEAIETHPRRIDTASPCAISGSSVRSSPITGAFSGIAVRCEGYRRAAHPLSTGARRASGWHSAPLRPSGVTWRAVDRPRGRPSRRARRIGGNRVTPRLNSSRTAGDGPSDGA